MHSATRTFSRYAKYELKAKYEAEVQENAKVAVAANPKQQLRNALFGEGIGEDMNFS
jgi:hypothetical protein